MKHAVAGVLVWVVALPAATAVASAQQRTTMVAVSPSEAETPPPPPPPARWSMALGVGSGGITGTDTEDFSQGVSWSLQLAYRLSRTLRLQLDGEYTGFARFDADPTKSQQQSSLTLGVRWAPFESDDRLRSPRIDLSNVYVKGGLGVGHLIRTPYDTLSPFRVEHGKSGGAVTAGIGWAPIQGAGYTLGLEATDSMVVFKDEVRHNFGLNFVVNVDLF